MIFAIDKIYKQCSSEALEENWLLKRDYVSVNNILHPIDQCTAVFIVEYDNDN